MTPLQIENKIEELKYWLEHNHNHPNRTTIESDLRKLLETKAEQEKNGIRAN